MNIICWTGYRNSGKTTLMQAVLSRLEGYAVPFSNKAGLKATLYLDARCLVLGSYRPVMAGSDRLATSEAELERFIRQQALDPERAGWTLVFEGERLFHSAAFMQSLARLDGVTRAGQRGSVIVLILMGSVQEMERRTGHSWEVERGWSDLVSACAPLRPRQMIHDTPADTDRIADMIVNGALVRSVTQEDEASHA